MPKATDTSYQRLEHVVNTKPTASIHANKKKVIIKDYVKIKVSLGITLIMETSHTKVLSCGQSCYGQQSGWAMWIVFKDY